MKALLSFSIVAVALLCGCNPDKSSDVQTNVTPIVGKAYDAPKGGATVNPNVPAAARAAIPGAGK